MSIRHQILADAAAAFAIFVAGCAERGEGLADQDAAFKIPAIKSAVAAHEPTAEKELVKSLDSEDPAVRFYAIEGLRRLTGQTLDYHYYEDAATRLPAVERWNAWLHERNR